LKERFEEFAVGAISACREWRECFVGRHLGGQFMRSATSSGANYQEACGAESRADFIHKLQIVLKELRECCYWLRLIKRSGIGMPEVAETLLNEADQLANIIGKSILTARRNIRRVTLIAEASI
jgi:four helix bundle protein